MLANLALTSRSKRKDAAEWHSQISRIELEMILPDRLISIDISLARSKFVGEINLSPDLKYGM
jgi:hypothetical protein